MLGRRIRVRGCRRRAVPLPLLPSPSPSLSHSRSPFLAVAVALAPTISRTEHGVDERSHPGVAHPASGGGAVDSTEVDEKEEGCCFAIWNGLSVVYLPYSSPADTVTSSSRRSPWDRQS